jgi:stage II sporulation protein P
MRRQNVWSFLKGILLIQLFFLSVIAGLTVDFNSSYLGALKNFQMISLSLPFSDLQINQRQADLMFQESYLPLTGSQSLLQELGINNMQPASIAENMIDAHIQVLAYAGAATEQDNKVTEPEKVDSTPNESAPKEPKDAAKVEPQLFKGQKIFIYCTHSAESYVPNGGKARVDGKRGLINSVAANLQKSIADQGIQAEFIDKIHDYPDYNQSYANSRSTVKQILQSNDKVLALFDVHRDSVPGVTTAPSIEIAGKKSARILIVVGTNERKPHPNWKKNYDFAEALYKQGEKMYPGLIRGVETKAGTYNQEFHPHALLLEFGTDYNTLEEASYAAQLFTDILLQVLKEDIQPK